MDGESATFSLPKNGAKKGTIAKVNKQYNDRKTKHTLAGIVFLIVLLSHKESM